MSPISCLEKMMKLQKKNVENDIFRPFSSKFQLQLPIKVNRNIIKSSMSTQNTTASALGSRLASFLGGKQQKKYDQFP